MRRLATFVRRFSRPTSARKICRPRAVSRYACLPRELSSSLNRSIHRSSSSLRNAPYSVPVLNVTRPSLISSTFFKMEYPWRGCSAKLTKISKTGSLNGNDSIVPRTTCRLTPYCPPPSAVSRRVFSSKFYVLRSIQNGVGALHPGAALLVFNRAVLPRVCFCRRRSSDWCLFLIGHSDRSDPAFSRLWRTRSRSGGIATISRKRAARPTRSPCVWAPAFLFLPL